MFNDIHTRAGSKLTSDFSTNKKMNRKITKNIDKETYPKPSDIQNMIKKIKKKDGK